MRGASAWFVALPALGRRCSVPPWCVSLRADCVGASEWCEGVSCLGRVCVVSPRHISLLSHRMTQQAYLFSPKPKYRQKNISSQEKKASQGKARRKNISRQGKSQNTVLTGRKPSFRPRKDGFTALTSASSRERSERSLCAKTGWRRAPSVRSLFRTEAGRASLLSALSMTDEAGRALLRFLYPDGRRRRRAPSSALSLNGSRAGMLPFWSALSPAVEKLNHGDSLLNIVPRHVAISARLLYALVGWNFYLLAVVISRAVSAQKEYCQV